MSRKVAECRTWFPRFHSARCIIQIFDCCLTWNKVTIWSESSVSCLQLSSVLLFEIIDLIHGLVLKVCILHPRLLTFLSHMKLHWTLLTLHSLKEDLHLESSLQRCGIVDGEIASFSSWPQVSKNKTSKYDGTNIRNNCERKTSRIIYRALTSWCGILRFPSSIATSLALLLLSLSLGKSKWSRLAISDSLGFKFKAISQK